MHHGRLLLADRRPIQIQKTQQPHIPLSLVHHLRLPRRPSARIAKDLIQLIQRPILGLRHQEVHIHCRNGTHEPEEDVCAVRCNGDKVGGAHGDGEIVEPVGRRADGYTFGTEPEGVDFGYNDPCTACQCLLSLQHGGMAERGACDMKRDTPRYAGSMP